MTNSLFNFLYLVYPIIVGVGILSLQLLIKQAEDVSKMQFSLGFVAFEGNFRRLWIVRMILLVLAIGFFIYPAFRDYSDLFPRHMQMEVFFDDNGLTEIVNKFSNEELQETPLAENWREHKKQYVDSLNKVLSDVKHGFRFDSLPGTVRSKGENSIEVKKLQSWSWQRYRIQSGRGNLKHTHEIPSPGTDSPQKPEIIESKFELLETASNYIDLSFTEIYWKWTKVVRPEYKQFFRLSPDKDHYNSHLTALSRVRFFPYVDIEETVYLVRAERDNRYVPIGYAVYFPD